MVPPHLREALFPGYRDPGFMGYGPLPAGGFGGLHGSNHLPFGPYDSMGPRMPYHSRRPRGGNGIRRGYPFLDDDSEYEDDLRYFSPRHGRYRPGEIQRFNYFSSRRRPGLHGLSRYYDPYRDGYDSDSTMSRMYDDDYDSDYMSPFSRDDYFDDYDDGFYRSRRRSRMGRGGRY
ncbi:hypothetical protein EV356DRAFT_517369 [Viridothelium virens]|uniref:Uncharacterized protein n=1 Tax=Viridothelium virens TaxID=1048519 RepID=A0A6A6H416_VIRVR|nr:hypothetical protein EV356DRAFT_517369 [Viridothelium virens]